MTRRKSTKQVLAVVQQQAQPGSGKAARNRRKRQNRKQNRGAIARAARTTPGRMTNWPKTRDGAAFVRAALDPFSDVALRSIGVPDSFAGDTLKHSNTMEITVVPDANGNIAFTILPSVSSPLLMLAGQFQGVVAPSINASFVPNGTVTGTWDATNGEWLGGTSNASFQAALPWPAWATYYGSQPDPSAGGNQGTGMGPYDYRSQRICSMGLEWRYTGTTLNDAGVCTAAIVDSYMIPGYEDIVATPTGYILPVTTSFVQRCDLTAVTRSGVNQTSLSNVPRYVQQTMHTSEGSGGMIVLVSGEDGFMMNPTSPDQVYIDATTRQDHWASGSVSTIGTLGSDGAVAPKPVVFPLQSWKNLRPVGVAFSGLPENQPIVIKLKQRVEATVYQNSPFAQFTDKSPTEDATAMCIVADVSKSLPVMVPVTMNGFGTWWKKIMSVISSAGKIVGGIGIPMVSQVASGIGGMADILGSFAEL